MANVEKAAKTEEPPRTGSTPRTDAEAFTYSEEGKNPTAGDLRAAGYEVPESIKDEDVPTAYRADTVRTDAAPFLVQDFTAPDIVHEDKTVAEWAHEQSKGSAAEKAGPPPEAGVLTTTVAKQAITNSKGSDAEKQGPRPKAEVLKQTVTQAAGTPNAPDA